MGFSTKYFFIPILILVVASCTTDDNAAKDEQKPTIDINYDEGFPQACSQLVRGETYSFKAMVSDNVELASYSLDIHHNFDHHTHDDQDGECSMDTKKTAINPWIFIENYSIEDGLTIYEISIGLTIPNDIDTGDYHCSFSVIDETGWQSRTSVDIKIID
ncbi:DUF4625 domain-containing protein [Arenibacter sp. F26102]|uniref:DUF4625 domain-containing protein n=1 Tax=Arenibacter sp. F26102 TaxID=2926416 RepID=UPI001FF3F58A|nr:DUF4625 domain-containing protein [Arenibacter sp. F26102]MCK0148073.1 DUF4625 domain-containing protein [Arenibacter sp. F26102]